MMTEENILQTIRSAIQDFVAPELREIRVRLDSLEKRIDARFEGFDDKMDSLGKQQEMQFRALMSAIHESKAESELSTLKLISQLSERVAVLESKRD